MALFLLIAFSLAAFAQPVRVLNGQAGSALEPLLKVRFSAAIQPATLRDGVSIVWLKPIQQSGFITYPDRYVMPINQVAWDPRTNTMYAKPDEALDHDREYSLVVGSGVRDISGAAVEPWSIVFRTQNVTDTINSIDVSQGLSLKLESAVDLQQVTAITNLFQTSAGNSVPLTPVPFPVAPEFLRQLGLRRLVVYRSETEQFGVNAWIPSTPPPPAGYPVVLIGHGLGDQRFSGPTLFASAVIANSVVLAIDAVGHGYGFGSRVRFDRNDGPAIEVASLGRGWDTDGDGKIESSEGCIFADPRSGDFIRGCLLRTVVDYRKLIREVQIGVDLDGDGKADLDPNRIQYIGQSLGAMYGTILTALDPAVEAAVLNVGGGSALETALYSPQLKPLLAQIVGETGFEPPIGRHEPVRILNDPLSGEYLENLDRIARIEADGAPASFAPFLKQATLYGNPIKRVLFQIALGDQTIPNPANSQLIRAAFEYDLVSLYRHDLARQTAPSLPANPHAYMAAFGQLDTPSLLIALATLTQASQFLASGRREVPDVNPLVQLLFPQKLFTTPNALPESTNFLQ